MKSRIGKVISILLSILLLSAAMLLSGCDSFSDMIQIVFEGGTPTPVITQTPEPVITPAAIPEATPVPTPTVTPEPTATPEPTPSTVTVAAVGDIMCMKKQVDEAFDEMSGTYDFSRSFTALKEMFTAVDVMCGNFECTICGDEVGFNRKQDSEGRIWFNAPEAFAPALKDAGFDVLTTANNHAGDKGPEGISHTIDSLRAAGFLQTGTYKEESDKKIPLIVEKNGIKIGIVAATRPINGTSKMSSKVKKQTHSMLTDLDEMQERINEAKQAGADFVIFFAHWDKEYENHPEKKTRKTAQSLLEMGADMVIGSHPHVVQPFEYMTVTRADGTEYTGLVAYSMGNFLANMSGASCYELYLQMTLEKTADGIVSIKDVSYMPLCCICVENMEDGTSVHETVPAFSDISQIKSSSALDEETIRQIQKARDHVLSVCGTDVVPVMEDSCWIN